MTAITDRTIYRTDNQATRSISRGRHRAEGPAITPFTALSRTAAEAAVRTGTIAVVTSGMLASVFTHSATAAPSESRTPVTLANKTLDTQQTGLTENLVTKVKVAQDAHLQIESGKVVVTPYAETEAGIKAAAKAKAEAEEKARAQAAAAAEAAAEAAAKAEAAAAAKAEAKAETQTAKKQTASAVQSNTSSSSASLGQQAVNLAREFIGVPYVWGGASPSGFDCSGLIQYVYAQLGISLPHSSTQISTLGYQVSASNARPGDIVWTPGHVALYAGNGMVVEAQQAGVPVTYTTMWQDNPTFIRVTG